MYPETVADEMREELARVKAERDALLAAHIGYEAAFKVGDHEADEQWSAVIPRHRQEGERGWTVICTWSSFPTLAEAESAILAAARAAAEVRAKGEAAGGKGGA